MIINTAYLEGLFNKEHLPRFIERACEALSLYDAQFPFEGIAFRGMSGAGIAFPVCARLGKFPMLVRKNDSSHGDPFEGCTSVKHYVIVDDFVDTGATLGETISKVSDWAPQAELVGVYFWIHTSRQKERDCVKRFGTRIVHQPFEEETSAKLAI